MENCLELFPIIMLALTAVMLKDLFPLLREVATHTKDETAAVQYVDAHGMKGVPILVGLQALQTILAVIPSAAIQILTGLCYGIWWGTLINIAGCALGNSIVFLTMAALRSRGLRTPWDYFALGTMLHYVADAFTLPHNAFGDRDLVRHAVYETELHPVFSGALLRERDPAERTEPRLLPALFAARRRDYGAAPRRMETDCRYIIGVCEQVLRGSLRCAAPAFAAGRESGGARPCEAPCRCGTL